MQSDGACPPTLPGGTGPCHLIGPIGDLNRYCPGSSSRAMLRFSTSTLGSPRNPSVRPWVYLLTSACTVEAGRCRAAATRLTWMSAYCGEMSGSRPEPEAVTASGGTWAGETPSNVAIAARRCWTVWASVGLFGPRLVAPEKPGSQP